MERNNKKDMLVTVAVLVLVVFIVGTVVVTKKKTPIDSLASASTANNTSSITDTTVMPQSTKTNATTASLYKDGTYTVKGDYATPENNESITLTVTLKSGTVTDTTATVSASSRESKDYTSQFLGSYKSLVVGKAISGLKLSRVSGSSLTSQGFNTAVQQIKTQAQS